METMKWERVGSLIYGTVLIWVIMYTPTICFKLSIDTLYVNVYIGSNILSSINQANIQMAFLLTALVMLPSIRQFNRRRWCNILLGLPWISACTVNFVVHALLFSRCIATSQNIVQRDCLIRAFAVYIYVMACAVEWGLHWQAVYRFALVSRQVL